MGAVRLEDADPASGVAEGDQILAERRSRTGGPSGAAISLSISAGIQNRRNRVPIAVPGPTRDKSSLSSCENMHNSVSGAPTRARPTIGAARAFANAATLWPRFATAGTRSARRRSGARRERETGRRGEGLARRQFHHCYGVRREPAAAAKAVSAGAATSSP